MSEYFRLALKNGWQADLFKPVDSPTAALPGEDERESLRAELRRREADIRAEEAEAASLAMRRAAQSESGGTTIDTEPSRQKQSAAESLHQKTRVAGAREALRQRYGDSFLFASPVESSLAPDALADASIEDAVLRSNDSTLVNVHDLLGSSGSCSIAQRHKIRPRSDLSRAALIQAIDSRLNFWGRGEDPRLLQ